MDAAVVGALTGFQKNMLTALKTIESIVAGFKTRCRGVEIDLWKEYQVIENALESRTRRLERLENLVRGGIGEQSGTRTEIAKLRTENRLLKAELNVTRNESAAAAAAAAAAASGNNNASAGSQVMPPTPTTLHRSKTSTTSGTKDTNPTNAMTRTNSTPNVPQAAVATSSSSSSHDSEKRWVLRLRELEKRLKAEREARLLDRSAAKKKVEEARGTTEEYKAELERERISKR